jgi:hypothetical protein
MARYTDSLRDRIASAIYNNNGFGWSKYMCEEAAEAVIAALGIREVAHCDECDHRRIISEWSD